MAFIHLICDCICAKKEHGYPSFVKQRSPAFKMEQKPAVISHRGSIMDMRERAYYEKSKKHTNSKSPSISNEQEEHEVFPSLSSVQELEREAVSLSISSPTEPINQRSTVRYYRNHLRQINDLNKVPQAKNESRQRKVVREKNVLEHTPLLWDPELLSRLTAT